jgi:glycosyltransferase involved in cell wall biosynthesis
MTQRVLYISYTGLMDPLGQSQVLQYVLALGRSGHSMTVLSFEKPDALADQARVAAMRALCQEAGVDWRARAWHNKPIGVVATLYDLIAGRRQAIRIARELGVEIVHCRSYIASLMGLAVKRATGAKLIFDMRGFWPDERVDGGIWSKSSLVYRVFKRLERSLFLNADHIVSLTKAGIREYEAFDYMKGEAPKSTVIPTCTNLDIFRPKDTPQEGFTLGYVGSVGSWYLFDEVAKVVARAFEFRSDARFLVITQGSHDLVRDALTKVGIAPDRFEVRGAVFSEVAEQIARMDAGIFFYRPTWSKLATSPTRLGEFLACGKPCLSNEGVGDIAENLSETGTGITLPAKDCGNVDLADLDTALSTLFLMASDPEMSSRCRSVAEERFSLAMGVAGYSAIYQQLAEHKS